VNEHAAIRIPQMSRLIDDTTMVGEQNDLRPGRQISQHVERGAGAFVVELDQDIIDDEGQGRGAVEMTVEMGQP
jgi:hypothetical protein